MFVPQSWEVPVGPRGPGVAMTGLSLMTGVPACVVRPWPSCSWTKLTAGGPGQGCFLTPSCPSDAKAGFLTSCRTSYRIAAGAFLSPSAHTGLSVSGRKPAFLGVSAPVGPGAQGSRPESPSR